MKTLNTGDKSARITLETLEPGDIPELAKMADLMEIEAVFLAVKREISQARPALPYLRNSAGEFTKKKLT